MSGLSDSRAVHVYSRTETDAIECRPTKAKFLCPPVLLPSYTSLHLYYIRAYKYYINGGEDINLSKLTVFPTMRDRVVRV